MVHPSFSLRGCSTILSGASGYLLKENLRKLPEVLATVVEQNSQVMQHREREWERRKSNQTLLAKSIAELREANFLGSDKIVSALQKVADNLG
jgi:hypothetical protein